VTSTHIYTRGGWKRHVKNLGSSYGIKLLQVSV